jgi:hypothetical protein
VIQRGRNIAGAMLKFTSELSDERRRLFLILLHKNASHP